ncbi:MAG: 4Fe-4S dicluster domain-containing protein [Anaerolineales bacterium]|nr:4Fe-4S dicluster domain-containing protein [Anaerolineales bacterium]
MEQSRLRELESLCIQECAPPCTSHCPVHVDIRQMAAAIKMGDFFSGLKIFRKSVPFPEIVARTCDQPCQKKCNRETLGGVIQVAQLEQACISYSTEPLPGYSTLPKKKSRVAIIGGGLRGLTAAFDLSRKGYQVDLYDEQQYLGGRLWDFPEEYMPRDVLVRETNIIKETGVVVHLSEKVDTNHVILGEVDAIYLAFGKSDAFFPMLDYGDDDIIQSDPITFQTNEPRFFTGKTSADSYSPIFSISDGRRAAISMDRFLQRVSLTASRVNEGVYETNLYTNITGISSVDTVLPGDQGVGYNKEEAQAEAARCLLCECMECVKVCEYLGHYGSYPKKYVRDIYNNLSMLVRARLANTFINSCALCGLCGEVCPHHLDMGRVNHETRQTMVKTSRMPVATHEFALRDMEFSNGEKFALAQNAPECCTSTYVFFPGCQLCGLNPEYVEKAYHFLRKTYKGDKGNVGLMLRCCGAPADWAGREDLFEKSQSEFWVEYEKLGKPKVILVCSSCFQMFQKYYPEIEIVSFWEVYDQYGNSGVDIDQKQLTRRIFSKQVAIHDPCSTRYEKHIQDAVRNILKKMGYEIYELPLSREKTECCSFGGLMWLANKSVAEKVVQRRINESPLDYVTYCAMCREVFARYGKRTLHLFDYIFGETEVDLALNPSVGFSQQHENRARLKGKLLKELWGGMIPEQEAFESIRLILPANVEKQVEDRLILVEDMQKVIEYAERTGKRLFNNATKHYLAYYKPTTVTYWVEYTPQENGSFLVHKAYNHRMEIGKGM